MRTSSSRGGPRSISGRLSRAHRSHSSRWRPASTSRCRRRSPPDRASRTGRHRSVGGSAWSSASRYSTRSRARVRLSCAATAPAVEPSSAARERVSCPATSWASSVSRSRSRQPAEGLGHRRPLLLGQQALVRGSDGRRSTTRCWLRRCRSCSRHRSTHDVARRHDRVRLEHPGSTRSAAARTRARVSCTRSSAVASSATRAATMRRTIGMRAATSSSGVRAAGRAQRPLCLHPPDASPSGGPRAASARQSVAAAPRFAAARCDGPRVSSPHDPACGQRPSGSGEEAPRGRTGSAARTAATRCRGWASRSATTHRTAGSWPMPRWLAVHGHVLAPGPGCCRQARQSTTPSHRE